MNPWCTPKRILERQPTILRVGIIGPLDAKREGVLAVATGPRDAMPIRMRWTLRGIALCLIQRTVATDHEIPLVVDLSVDVVLLL